MNIVVDTNVLLSAALRDRLPETIKEPIVAKQDADAQDNTNGAGLGMVDIYGVDGTLVKELVMPGGALNGPWGLALAPSDFGTLSNTLLVYSGLCGIAIGLVILTLLPHVWSTLVGNFITGIAVAAIIVPAQTLFQQATPPELLGRVGSTFMSIVFAAQIAGLVLSGILTQHMGVRPVFALCAVMLVVLMAVGKLWMEPKKTTA